ncbi:hypothetical protein [Sphaerisporangium dianthi]|uniref:VCBS repeat-containing protein n=1 Tax=Sphaerisporangium dianthi TaxID=1436120 RepID=A0ABV9CLQ6_9ACTN
MRRLSVALPLLVLLPLGAAPSYGSPAVPSASGTPSTPGAPSTPDTPTVSGAPGTAGAPIVSGAPGTPLTSGTPPVSGVAPDECADAGTADFDGDGFNDVVVGDPFGEPADQWSGSGGLFFLRGTRAGFPEVISRPFDRSGGLSGWTARAGHIDGDGCLDLVVANPHWIGHVTEKSSGRVTPVPGAGSVTVYWGGSGFGRSGPGDRLDLRAPAPRNGAHYGWSLAVASGVVAVGAPYEDADGIPDSGAVYLYRFGGADGREAGVPRRITQQSPGVPGDGEAGDLFGWSLALGPLVGGPGAELAIGAPYEDTPGKGAPVRDAGAVTVLYDPADGAGTWYRGKGWELSELTDEVPAREGDLFGYSLAYGAGGGPGRLAAGAPYADPRSVEDAGLVQLFSGGRSARDPRPAGTLWQETEATEVSEPHDAFGFSLAFSGSRDLLVGAPYDGDGSHPETGAVHMLTLGETDPASGEPVNPGRPLARAGHLTRARNPQSFEHFGWAVSGAGDGWAVIGAPDRDGTGAIGLVPLGGADAVPLRPGDGRTEPSGQSDRTPYQGMDFGAAVAG